MSNGNIDTYIVLLQTHNLLLTKPKFHLKCVNPRFSRYSTLLHHLFLPTPNNLRLPHIQSYRGLSTKTKHKILSTEYTLKLPSTEYALKLLMQIKTIGL